MFHFVFYRTLNSQSAASVTVSNLVALLREKGYRAKMTLLDKRDGGLEQNITSEAKLFPYLVYKVNSMDFERTFAVLERLQKNNTFKKVLLIGPFASLNADRIMEEYKWVDAIILGSGECAVLKYAAAISEQKVFEEIHGIIIRKKENGEICKNREVVPFPLTSLPLPARDVDIQEKGSIANLEFSRGCENRCKYCHLRVYLECYGQKRSRKTVDQVMEDITYLYKIGKRYLIFNDSVFWNGEEDTDHIEELCDRIIESEMDIYFMVYLSLYHFPDFSLIEKMSRAGLIRIFIGVENMSGSVLARIKEDTYPCDQYEIIKHRLDGLHISCHIGYIVFYPFSTLQQVRDSIEYLHAIGKTFRVGIVLEKMRLIPGTPMEKYIDRGIGQKNFDLSYSYCFKDSRVGKLHDKLDSLFEVSLSGKYIHMELLCCGVELAGAVFMKRYGSIPAEIKEQTEEYMQVRKKYSDWVYQMYMNLIKSLEDERDFEIDETFMEQFFWFEEKLLVKWNRLMKSIQFYMNDFDLKELIPL